MDAISEHFYCGDKPDLLDHVRQIPDNIRAKADAHRDYRKRIPSLVGKNIPIAMDEWNYWHDGPQVYGELGIQYRLKDALGIAAGLNEFARQSDIIAMANYAQTVNVIGAIDTTKTAAGFATTGLVLKLYRQHFGTLPVRVETELPLDVAAAWTADRKTLTVAVVNPTPNERELPLTLDGARLPGPGQDGRISGSDPMAINEPGKTPRVAIDSSDIEAPKDRLTVAPYSMTLFAWPAESP
jgi:alpha-N-arabinofuranosidase